MRFLTNIDLTGQEIQNVLVHNNFGNPTALGAGQIYFDTDLGDLMLYDGSSWISVSGDIKSVSGGAGLTGTAENGPDVVLNVGQGNGITVATDAISVNAEATQFEFSSGVLTISSGAIGPDELESTGVVAGSYGDSTNIATFTVDEDGRLTAAGTSAISTTLSISGDIGADTVSLIDGTLNFEGADGITTTVSDDNVRIDVDSTVVRTSGDQTIAGNKTFSNNVVVNGDLTVSGTTTTVNTETINLADNIILLNSNSTGTPTENAGIEVKRGDVSNVQLIWNETASKWQIEIDPFNDTYENIATENYVGAQVANNSNVYTIVGDDTTSSFPVSHGLNTLDVIVQLYDTVTLETVYADVVRTNTSSVTVTFGSAPSTGQNYRVLLTKVQ